MATDSSKPDGTRRALLRRRRGWVRRVLVGGASLAAAAPLLRGLPGHLPQDTDAVNAWLRGLKREVAAKAASPDITHASVQAFAHLIERDAIVRMYVIEMNRAGPERAEDGREHRRAPRRPRPHRRHRAGLQQRSEVAQRLPGLRPIHPHDVHTGRPPPPSPTG